ncbi:MAG TPA: C40 family peptidase [Casimicrobiaceae bacterium]|nr:C40 family peptidase [Casimicrobiaceae bacterium]
MRFALRPLAVAALAVLATHGTATLAAGHAAKPSLGETAQASLGAAATRALEAAQDVAIYALSLVGVDYRYGGATPDRGLDCSGLIRYVFQQTTGVTLPRTAHELARIGASVSRSELVPGDLVFFNTRRSAFSHVGIYLGDGQFIHAPSKGREVGVAQLSSSYWKKRYDGARRLVGVLPSLMPSIVSPAIAGTADADPAPGESADRSPDSGSAARPDAAATTPAPIGSLP